MDGTFEVETGTDLLQADCNDALIPPGPIVVSEWNAIDGTAALTVTALSGPAGPGTPFTGTVQISGVVVELDGSPGTTCEVPDTSWSGLYLGWLPG